MSILVFGRTGQVGRELVRLPGIRSLGRAEADLTDPAACTQVIRDTAPNAVINAAAYTAVDRAEEEETLAHVINAAAPAEMAVICAALNIPFVTISTDYVFDGSGQTPWRPDDPTAPINAYGRTKRAGEEAVIGAGGRYGILRTSWIVSAHGDNFVKTMLRLGAERDQLTIVADQIGGPTPARAIAVACARMAEGLARDPGLAGIYHFAGQGDVSWADFARAIFARAGLACAVKDIPTSAYPAPAARPLNSRLDCASLEASFGITRPDWNRGLQEILDDLDEAL